MGDQLVDFIRGKKEKASGGGFDWKEKKEVWVRSVENLYRKVQDMLRDSIASGDVTTHVFPVELTEDFIGSYSIPVLELKVGRERVEFRPKGVTVIGASGRVDIRGERETLTLIKRKAEADSAWSVIVQRVPDLRTLPLNRNSLKYILERVMLP